MALEAVNMDVVATVKTRQFRTGEEAWRALPTAVRRRLTEIIRKSQKTLEYLRDH